MNTERGIFMAWRTPSGSLDNGWFYDGPSVVRWLKALGERVETIIELRIG